MASTNARQEYPNPPGKKCTPYRLIRLIWQPHQFTRRQSANQIREIAIPASSSSLRHLALLLCGSYPLGDFKTQRPKSRSLAGFGASYQENYSVEQLDMLFNTSHFGLTTLLSVHVCPLIATKIQPVCRSPSLSTPPADECHPASISCAVDKLLTVAHWILRPFSYS